MIGTTDILTILQYAPKGIKLYSPVCGKVEFEEVSNNLIYTNRNHIHKIFDSFGRYNGEAGECVLFPSESVREWHKWQDVLFREGDIVWCDRYSEAFIWNGKDENGIHTVLDNSGKTHQISDDVCVYANPTQVADFNWQLNVNGFEYDKDTNKLVDGIKKKQQFNVGDWVVFDNSRGPLLITEVLDSGYSADRVCIFGIFKEHIPFEKEIHLHRWTIKDAQMGDVLHLINDSDNVTLLFDYYYDDMVTEGTFDSICSVFNGRFCAADETRWIPSLFRPATEKEINEFVTAMNNVGYVWDVRTRKLIYIE